MSEHDLQCFSWCELSRYFFFFCCICKASRWLFHVSMVLRGAIGMAESILLGHPVLVHCSDGWDRTAQLSALTQVTDFLTPFLTDSLTDWLTD